MTANVSRFAQVLHDPFFAETLFDRLTDVVFFVKDQEGRYMVVNRTLMQRCRCQTKRQLIGRSPLELFPPELGESYVAQDRLVLERGQSIQDRLELHLYVSRAAGWCLTYKIPLLDAGGRVIGLAGISKDLRLPDQRQPVYAKVAAVIAYIQEHYAEPLRLVPLAAMAGLSVVQFERILHRIFELTPKQLIIKTRLEAAARMLAGPDGVAEIAYACGYADHSAFARQFKLTVGLSPTDYRALLRAGGTGLLDLRAGPLAT